MYTHEHNAAICTHTGMHELLPLLLGIERGIQGSPSKSPISGASLWMLPGNQLPEHWLGVCGPGPSSAEGLQGCDREPWCLQLPALEAWDRGRQAPQGKDGAVH